MGFEIFGLLAKYGILFHPGILRSIKNKVYEKRDISENFDGLREGFNILLGENMFSCIGMKYNYRI